MKLTHLLKTFSKDESGAVTVDWVVLTAAIVGLGIVVMGTISGGVDGLGGKISTSVNADSMIGAGTSYSTTGTTTP